MTKEEVINKKICPILLGCDKNRVDLEKMLFLLKDYGFKITNDIENCDIVIVQTCSFILPAKKEAIDNILEAINLKNQNRIEKIIVSGCLPQINLSELQDSLPEVDAFVLIKNYSIIVNTILELYDVKLIKPMCSLSRLKTTPKHYAYLKIADGCNNCCTYCTIPRIRGRYKSVPMPELVKEAKELASGGVKELIIVAQDTTKYGLDLYGEIKFVELLKKLCEIKGIEWIRLLYCYPELVSNALLDFIDNEPKMCKYLDIPIQHIDNDILKAMNRKTSEDNVRDLIHKIHTYYPEIALRSTFIVGFPGETAKKFKKLEKFIENEKLDFVGFFPYSREENTKAFYMSKQIPNFIKKLRLKRIQKVQYNINNTNAIKRIGKTEKVVIDSFDEQRGLYIGRNQYFAPEVDFYIEIADNSIEIGHFYNVKITDFINQTFKGEIV